ncbi:MAG: hypothetical protein DLD55_05035 [candidate division SR1 bacterium]|nr:MAG: hypothetical protein DLD55_05035 [candidate division SR1 bacterium]
MFRNFYGLFVVFFCLKVLEKKLHLELKSDLNFFIPLMKKVAVFASLFGCLFFVGCQKFNPQEFQNYTNNLLSLQEEAVDLLQDYYQGKNFISGGLSPFELYTSTLESLQRLSQQGSDFPVRKGDAQLRDGVATYLSGLVFAFSGYEGPLMEQLSLSSGAVLLWYQEHRSLISENAMSFAKTLAELDKSLQISYSQFISEHF